MVRPYPGPIPAAQSRLRRLALALCAACSVHGAGREVNVRDFGARGNGGDDGAAIQRAIDAAGRIGPGAVVTIPAGHYRLIEAAGRPAAYLRIDGLRGLTVRGEGRVVLDCSNPDAHIFSIQRSAGVRIESLVLERHPFLYTQGIVKSVSIPDRTADVAIDPGYDDPDAKYLARMRMFMVFSDPGSGSWHHDASSPPMIERRERLAPGLWRLTLSRPPIPAFAGSPFVIWTNLYGGWAFSMRRSRDVAVDNVAYYAHGGQAGFVVNHCEGDISFHRFSVAVEPGTNQLFASAGGAMVFNNRIRLRVDDCDFAATDDDGINMGTNSSHVLAQLGPKTLEIEAGEDRADYRPGDHVALMDWVAKRERLEAVVAGVSPTSRGLAITLDRDATAGKTGAGPWKEFITRRRPPNADPGNRDAMHAARRANEVDGIDRLVNLDDAGSAVIRNSRFQSYRARNILMKAPNSIIENNVFHDTVMASVLVGPEFYWDEAPMIRHLIVRHNLFVNDSGSNILVGAWLTWDEFPNAGYPAGRPSSQSRDNRDILIEGNVFSGYGRYAFGICGRQGSPIFVRNADDVVIRDNVIGAPDPACPRAPRILVTLSDHVVEKGNEVTSDPSRSAP